MEFGRDGEAGLRSILYWMGRVFAAFGDWAFDVFTTRGYALVRKNANEKQLRRWEAHQAALLMAELTEFKAQLAKIPKPATQPTTPSSVN